MVNKTGEHNKIVIYNYIKDYVTCHAYPPTLAEIMDKTSLSKTTVSFHINRMLDNGILETDDRCSSRALRIPGTKVVFSEK